MDSFQLIAKSLVANFSVRFCTIIFVLVNQIWMFEMPKEVGNYYNFSKLTNPCIRTNVLEHKSLDVSIFSTLAHYFCSA